jgi:hypothetical protein
MRKAFRWRRPWDKRSPGWRRSSTAETAVINRFQGVKWDAWSWERRYLLSLNHPVGRAKAKFFRSHGYSDDNVQVLAADLRRIASEGQVVEQESTAYVMKYVVEGSILKARLIKFTNIQ